MTEAVTVALRERLDRELRRRNRDDNLIERLTAFADRIAANYDTRPLTKEEWDAALGEEE